jgi:hypothetical protein
MDVEDWVVVVVMVERKDILSVAGRCILYAAEVKSALS